MARQTYGTLRGSRRAGNGAWQWIVIGFVVGFGCAAVIGLGLVIASASGWINLDGVLAANRSTQTPIVITNTPAPVTPTPLPTEGLLPSATQAIVQPVLPSATPQPTNDPNQIQVEPSATNTTQPLPTQPVAAAAATIPPLLAGLTTPLQKIDGGSFKMGTTPQEVANAVNECVNIYNGSCDIAMGQDSAPVHDVTLNAYQMEETEVTYEQYLAFLNSKGANSHRTSCDGQLCIATRGEDPNSNIIFDSANYRVNDTILNYPVAGVTWYGAKSYCEAIGRRLPTEAEWEHAARPDDLSIYPWGATFDVSLARTNRPIEEDANLRGAKAISTYPVGAFGLFDMAGNVAEWVSDWYAPNYYSQLTPPVLNPQGPVAGTDKVVRGGSWADQPFFARAVHRMNLDPTKYLLSIGFRCAAAAATAGANTTAPVAAPPVSNTTGGSSEEQTSSQPTLPPPPVPTSSQPLPTLAP